MMSAMASSPRTQAAMVDRRASIAIENVSQIFPTRDGSPSWALRDVSLSVAPGEFVCLIGPSGCGKTTLLQLVAGFLTPTAGRVLIGGEPVGPPGPDRGVVFQEYALFAWMTARQNVEFGLRMQGVGRVERRERSAAALERVGLARAADRYPHELSGGMRQRVAVARALINRPRVLLMDEPFAAVDAMTRATLQEDLLALWQDAGVSVMFVTHNIDEAVFLAQRVIVMGAHPGSVRSEVTLDAPYPRQRGSAAFAARYAEVGRRLEQEEEPTS
jgi:NitT/TauT family transport system ATP-binding protein